MVERAQVSNWWPSVYEPFKRAGQKVADWFAPKSDAAATHDNYRITVELPGVSREDIEVSMSDDRLIVKGEKRVEHEEKTDNYFFSEREFGAFRRTFHIPADADGENVAAEFKDGVLTVIIPKNATSNSRARKIPITV